MAEVFVELEVERHGEAALAGSREALPRRRAHRHVLRAELDGAPLQIDRDRATSGEGGGGR